MVNFTTNTGFLLVSFSGNPEIEILQASLFLVLYIVALIGNILIITATSIDHSLNSPMYFFLKHLSCLDLCYITVTVPRSIFNSLMHTGTVSLWECILQCFAFTACVSVEVAILTVVSYDRYVAICFPLRYEIIMNVSTCVYGVLAVWISGILAGVMHTAATFSIRFCGPKIIHQFFCDVPQLLKLSCSNDYTGELGIIAFLALVAFVCFIFIGFSYTHIFSSVLRIPSAKGRTKAFSTCLPHLCVVTLFFSTAVFEFLKPHSDSPTVLDFLLTVLYAVVPPTLNPMIYSLRNKVMKAALRKVFKDSKVCLFFLK
ncbi:PREDICTED: olfactory receptor 14J1-like [Elephantulus edwardii]|uniref:olfactory receptor 14J1-like n=1 Tax=Elephantulus edwardii TaxID=28737 RepID=UPI0003F0BD7F|nr:PREDICTED: olfactory receptor 14J1-like [Elephantulus edwardii]